MRQSLYDYCVENQRMELLEQWDEEANLPQTTQTVSYGSNFKAQWRCSEGHEWRAQICSRTGNRSGCPVCTGKAVIAGVNDLASKFPSLAKQWHPTKNGEVTPRDVGAYTHRKAWWQCKTCGHEWYAEIKSRANGNGCPVCAGKTVIEGVNDFASKFPNLAEEWHPTKNEVLSAGDISPGSRKKAWWRCKTCHHEWQASIYSRTQGTGCPVCTGKTVIAGVNDLASQFPSIAEEWHPTKNGTLTPQKVTPQSNRTVWWRCALGHEYQSRVASRTSDKVGCPYCSDQRVLKGFNDLATILPKVAKQWHPTLNEGLTPEDVTCGSAKKVWWKCNICGYEWKAVIYSRAGAQRCGCPACAGVVKTNNRAKYQRIAAEGVSPKPKRRIISGHDSPVQCAPPGKDYVFK